MTDPDTEAVLADHVRRLDTDARAALVADLWTARGFETTREGSDVVATGRGASRRIRIGAGSGRGRGSADRPDVVISTGSRTAHAAAGSGVRVLDAEDVAAMLRYAVDRSTARALCERHLGAPPEELRPPATARLRAHLGGLRASVGNVESPVAPASFLVAALALLIAGVVAGMVLTAASGPAPSASPTTSAGADDAVDAPSIPESTPVGDSAVVTPATSESPGDPPPNASAVPGLSEDRITDLSALATAHARGLLGQSYTLWMDTYRPPRGDPDGAPIQYDTDVAVADDRFLVVESVGDGESRERRRAVYDDDRAWFVANWTGGNATYTRVLDREQVPVPPPDFDDVALNLVTDYLSTPETTVEGRAANGSGGAAGATRYRVVGRGTPPTIEGDVRNYTAVALIDRDGVVRDLTVTYTVIEGEESYRVRKEWTYGYLGETTVTPPDWYAARFGPNVTST
ncbi:hypothetical protein ACFQE8_05935 [Salinirubellus sp. GCM10025818]|uniref:hypothetical protein n=1 Tax=Salinirubellus TaxID=2162630 RepID=UPI0030D3940B